MLADRTLSALADPTRRAIFELLVGRGPQAVTELAELVPVSRPAVSQHLKALVGGGLAQVRTDGRRRIYSADPTGLAALATWLDGQWDAVLDRFQHAARRKAEEMTAETELAPVVKRRTVPLAPHAAFELFTARMGDWWPTGSHSIEGDEVVSLRFEGRVGGRVVEVARDGTEHSWADVLAWDPPNRFVLSWHPNRSPVAASRLEVRFDPVEGGTEVVLVHDGFEEFASDAPEVRDRYESGWELVLAPFESAARI